MGFKKELKALEILEKPEAFLTKDFDVNTITHSKLFNQTRSQNIIHLTKRPVFIYRLGGEGQSSPTEYKGDYKADRLAVKARK